MYCRLLVENKSILEIGWLELLKAQTIVSVPASLSHRVSTLIKAVDEREARYVSPLAKEVWWLTRCLALG